MHVYFQNVKKTKTNRLDKSVSFLSCCHGSFVNKCLFDISSNTPFHTHSHLPDLKTISLSSSSHLPFLFLLLNRCTCPYVQYLQTHTHTGNQSPCGNHVAFHVRHTYMMLKNNVPQTTSACVENVWDLFTSFCFVFWVWIICILKNYRHLENPFLFVLFIATPLTL